MAKFFPTGGGVINPPTDPTTEQEKQISLVDDKLYYWDGGERYVLTATLDTPVQDSLVIEGSTDLLLTENGNIIVLE